MTSREIRNQLAEAKNRFSEWRNRSSPGESIPEELWQQTLKLTKHYSRSFIASELKLDHESLRQRLGIRKRTYRKGVTEKPRFAVVTPEFAQAAEPKKDSAKGALLFEVESQGMTVRFYR